MYDKKLVDQQFRDLANAADARVRKLARAIATQRHKDQHDEALAQLSVYRFMRERPFVNSREALLEELIWFHKHDNIETPLEVQSLDRFHASRHSLLRTLIRRIRYCRAGTEHWEIASLRTPAVSASSSEPHQSWPARANLSPFP